MSIGKKIQMLRARNGLSQEGLAELLGVTRQSVSKWELDQAQPDVEKVVQLSRLFKVRTDALLLQELSAFEKHDSQKLHFGMYLIVKDFAKSIDFYEKLLSMQASAIGVNRFAIFHGWFSIMNEAHLPGHDYSGCGDHKFALNFWIEDLRMEHERVKSLNIGRVTGILTNAGYSFFNIYDPDGNIIEITGRYKPR
ncbi:MAG: helix-turn-helix domain-containing protein [Firmicutes bacterium]|nr:helix-turn-helix domain-containing protein [Bacillota bacterium]